MAAEFVIECPICLDREVDVELQCKHEYCLRCAIKVNTCPMCRSEVLRIFLLEKSELDNKIPIEFPDNPLLFKSISDIIKKHRLRVSELITQVSFEVKGFLSLTQTETLLSLAKTLGILDYKVEQNIVKLCNTPWSVDVGLGGSGVCYFGNTGYVPDNYQHARGILRENEACILHDMNELLKK